MIYDDWLDGKYITHVHLKIGNAKREYYVKGSYDYAKRPPHRDYCQIAEQIAITADGKFIAVYFLDGDGFEMVPIHCVQTIRWREVEDE